MAIATSQSWKFVAPPPLESVFPGLRRTAPRRVTHAAPGTTAEVLPRRRLRLAEYLFHSGRISWKECCAAVQWQRDQRPSVGRIAITLGWLTQEQVARLLRERVTEKAYRTPFCEFAMAKGFLTERQVAAILGQQRRLQRRIGEYFVERGILSRAELEGHERRLREHNAQVPSR